MLVAALTLATTNKILIDAIFKPVKEKFVNHDFWWLFYVSLVTGAAIGWFSEANLFTEFMPNPIVGRILTSLFVGGGASLIHELFSSTIVAIRSVSIKNWGAADVSDATAEKTRAETDWIAAETPATTNAPIDGTLSRPFDADAVSTRDWVS